MVSRSPLSPQIVIVDSRPEDYRDLQTEANEEGLSLEVLNSGRAALRRDASTYPSLWVVNMRLPDITGPDLLTMLHEIYPGVPVCLVSDDYRCEDEIEARCNGAELYACKPLDAAFMAAGAQL